MTGEQEAFIAKITVELEELSARLSASVHDAVTIEQATRRGTDAITCQSAARLLVMLEENRRRTDKLITDHVNNIEKAFKA
jgi:hypothetical protein